MDKITQQNAASAEESASASEEMNAQAEQMKRVVGELIALVGGGGNRADGMVYAEKRKQKARDTDAAHGFHTIIAPVKKAREKAVTVHQKREVQPDEVIPMDDDFKDFK